jgi:hypothetical protein
MSLGLHGNNTAMMPGLGLLVVSAEGDWGPNGQGKSDSVFNQRLRLIAHCRHVSAETAKTVDAPGAGASREASKPADQPIVLTGVPKKWQTLTLTFRGPESSEAGTPNPFLDYRLDVTFQNGDRRMVVPGSFAADGDAAESSAVAGNRWRAKFVPTRWASGRGKPRFGRERK